MAAGSYYRSSIPELAKEVHYDDSRYPGDARYHVLETILEAAKANGQKVGCLCRRFPFNTHKGAGWKMVAW